MTAPQGHCWLCRRFGPLTKEHIPPQSAFNNFPLLLYEVDERSSASGALGWTPKQKFTRGVFVRSVCGKCNNWCGRHYGGAYVDVVRHIAERIGDVQDFHTISLAGVKRPLAILKQVVFQFVSANGSGFVPANDWVAPFLRSTSNRGIPPEVGVYLFASNCRGGKRTGVSSHIDLAGSRKVNIISEFSYWPLGTIMSFGHLEHRGLAAIHPWAQYPYDYAGTVDLTLPVNPTHSPYPLDFRSESQVTRDASTPHPEIVPPSEEDSRRMVKETIARSGADEAGFIFSAHPDTAKKLTKS